MGHDLGCTDEFCVDPSSLPLDTHSGGPVLGPFQRGRKHMEAMMSVDDLAQQQTIRIVIRTGEQVAQ
ncbi:hypothetical protein [Nocardia gipuzkoensis]